MLDCSIASTGFKSNVWRVGIKKNVQPKLNPPKKYIKRGQSWSNTPSNNPFPSTKKMYGLFKRDRLFRRKGCKDLKGCMAMNGLNKMLFGIREND